MKSFLNKFQTMSFSQLIAVNGGYGGSSGGGKHYDSSGGYSSSSGLSAKRYQTARANAAKAAAATAVPKSTAPAGYDALTSGLDGEAYVKARENAAKTNGAYAKGYSVVDAAVVNANGAAQWNQRDFSDAYGNEFGEHACAATSLLNEISEVYTSVTGKEMTADQASRAMYAAVLNGGIDGKCAYVASWETAANSMAEAVGLEGSFVYTTDKNKATNVIYCEYKGNGKYHFVNTVGTDNESVYDPYSGGVKTLSQVRNEAYAVTTRCLIYKTK